MIPRCSSLKLWFTEWKFVQIGWFLHSAPTVEAQYKKRKWQCCESVPRRISASSHTLIDSLICIRCISQSDVVRDLRTQYEVPQINRIARTCFRHLAWHLMSTNNNKIIIIITVRLIVSAFVLPRPDYIVTLFRQSSRRQLLNGCSESCTPLLDLSATSQRTLNERLDAAWHCNYLQLFHWAICIKQSSR